MGRIGRTGIIPTYATNRPTMITAGPSARSVCVDSGMRRINSSWTNTTSSAANQTATRTSTSRTSEETASRTRRDGLLM